MITYNQMHSGNVAIRRVVYGDPQMYVCVLCVYELSRSLSVSLNSHTHSLCLALSVSLSFSLSLSLSLSHTHARTGAVGTHWCTENER